ncbi:MAG: undecaprenyl-diphosphate phosphatase [Deltaproteobacteria bacterium]|nr:undecaprenyl-diphosphate phosphatase [Deltaproteobacteria bacterium]MBW2309153.1 undecaprenyl-diphosphate phosphatase [Deltaproteobacteria bacterium]
MITWIHAVFLGAVQGLTEFLPVSSSGHLVLFQHFMGLKEPEVLLDAFLHAGTLVAVLIVFRGEIREMLAGAGWVYRSVSGKWIHWSELFEVPAVRMMWLIAVGTVPTVIVGLVFRERLELMFGEPCTVGWMLLLTGSIVGATRFLQKGTRGLERSGVIDALVVGLAQGLAIIPGISRSGATIAVGIFLGMEREWVGRYSFLLSIPSILGALFLSWASREEGGVGAFQLLAGATVAGLVGYGALKVLMMLITRGKFYGFAPYCGAVGIVTLWGCM